MSAAHDRALLGIISYIYSAQHRAVVDQLAAKRLGLTAHAIFARVDPMTLSSEWVPKDIGDALTDALIKQETGEPPSSLAAALIAAHPKEWAAIIENTNLTAGEIVEKFKHLARPKMFVAPEAVREAGFSDEVGLSDLIALDVLFGLFTCPSQGRLMPVFFSDLGLMAVVNHVIIPTQNLSLSVAHRTMEARGFLDLLAVRSYEMGQDLEKHIQLIRIFLDCAFSLARLEEEKLS